MTGVNEMFTRDGRVSVSQTWPYVTVVGRLVSRLLTAVSRPRPSPTSCPWSTRHVTSAGPGPSSGLSVGAARPGRPTNTAAVQAVAASRHYNKTRDICNDSHLGLRHHLSHDTMRHLWSQRPTVRCQGFRATRCPCDYSHRIDCAFEGC